jgi:hypothetical protein
MWRNMQSILLFHIYQTYYVYSDIICFVTKDSIFGELFQKKYPEDSNMLSNIRTRLGNLPSDTDSLIFDISEFICKPQIMNY